MEIGNRLIYKLPDGEWNPKGSDHNSFFFSTSLGPSPRWSFKHRGKKFGISDLREVYKAKLDRNGMLDVLNRYGPWDLRVVRVDGEARGKITVEFADWHFRACAIQRAFYLWRSLKSGAEFEWVHLPRGGRPALGLKSWPRKLRLPDISEEYQEWLICRSGPLSSLDADFHDSPTARRLAKVLLAQLIDQGLEGVNMSFRYSLPSNRFRLDVGDTEVLPLEKACWLMLRDLTAGLSGLRFCANCGEEIPRTVNSHAMTCSKTACKKAYYRTRKAAAVNG